LNLTGGKYFAEGKFYSGVNLWLYPTLEANYRIELFGTWNHNDFFQLTPIIGYSSYEKINAGIGLGFKLGENIIIQAGSTYLNTIFSDQSIAGTGGFIRLVFVN